MRKKSGMVGKCRIYLYPRELDRVSVLEIEQKGSCENETESSKIT